jgi:hypothetical protein
MPAEKSPALGSPWREFFHELDVLLSEEVRLHCIGGFVISAFYGLPRPTGDVDYCSVSPFTCAKLLQEMAGPGSSLARKYGVNLQYVAVTTMSADYEERLVEMFPGEFGNLRLSSPDPYDLILSKLERNNSKDRDDVEYLAQTLRLDPQVLRDRYEKCLRPYLAYESRHDLTLKLWIESCFQA